MKNLKSILAVSAISAVTALTSFNSVYATDINVTSNTDKTSFSVSLAYEDQDDGSVKVIATGSNEFKPTKGTWTLNEENPNEYSKVYGTDQSSYTTIFEDIYGNQAEMTINSINAVDFDVTITPSANIATGEVTYSAVPTQANRKFKATKGTWKLDEEGTTYSKTFNKLNLDSYKTTFVDVYGNKVEAEIPEVTNFAVSVSSPVVNPDDKTTKIVKVTSCVPGFGNTESNVRLKPENGWTLVPNHENQLQKVYSADVEDEEVAFTDVFGDVVEKEITVSDVDFDITTTAARQSDGTVLVTATANQVVDGSGTILQARKFKNTKPTWTLSEDGLTYTKKFTTTKDYKTTFEDVYGNKVEQTIEFGTQTATDFEVTIANNDTQLGDGSVTLKATANGRKFKNNKPTWKLDSTGKVYTKTFGVDTNSYKTVFTDEYGTTQEVTIPKVDADELKIEFDYVVDNTTGVVTAKAYANPTITTDPVSGATTYVGTRKFKETKPTWELDKSGKVYTKKYAANTTYRTTFVDEYGNEKVATIEVTTAKGFTVSVDKGVYDPKTDTVTVTATGNRNFKENKSTWQLSSSNPKEYTKKYSSNETYLTKFTDEYGNVINKEINVTAYKKFAISSVKFNEVDTDNVEVVITANKPIAAKEGWTVVNHFKGDLNEETTDDTTDTYSADSFVAKKKFAKTALKVNSKFTTVITAEVSGETKNVSETVNYTSTL